MNVYVVCLLSVTFRLALCSKQDVNEISTPSVKMIIEYGNFSSDNECMVNEHREILLVFRTEDRKWPFRIISSTTNASLKDSPVLVVIQQQLQVLSWSVPLSVNPSDDVGFPVVERTLCDENLTQPVIGGKPITFKNEFAINLSSYSSQNVSINVRVEEVPNFYVESNKTYNITVSASKPQYYFYRDFNDSSVTIKVNITSHDEGCFIASIQKKRCPVFDLNKDIAYDSTYQTIDKQGGMRILAANYKDGFFLVFVAKPNNDDCYYKDSIYPRDKLAMSDPTETIIHFTLSPGASKRDYIVAPLALVGTVLGFMLFVVFLACIFSKYGTIQERERDDQARNLLPEDNEGEQENVQDVDLREIPEDSLKVHVLTIKSVETHKKSLNYLWQILSVGLFYAIPTVQLALTYQRVMNRTGDEDLCYYNFLCANPFWIFNSFNHVFSNIGYILLGILFLVMVKHHRTVTPQNDNGFPLHYGIFYAMGNALILEGILSACYHICPNESNFQFDTTFMYVMIILCMVKLYQNRHSDITASAYTTFSVVGAIILMAMFGIIFNGYFIWALFIIIHLGLCICISFKIYYLGFGWDGFSNFRNVLKNDGISRNTLKPRFKKRFIVLLTVNIVNYSLLAIIYLLDFGTFLLIVLMSNAVLYSLTYVYMKIAAREPLGPATITYGLLAIIFWGIAGWFFLKNGTSWRVSPAQSRHWNQECIILNFYDTHDVWHLLSACALYFTFMFLLCLDDNLIQTERHRLDVF